MDFSAIFQLRTKKFWWMDVILYFAIAVLIATVFCYVAFWAKDNIQRTDIQKETDALKSVGTDSQKEQEKEVLDYQKRIDAFSSIFKNHQFASDAFAFMQTQTMPDIWFKQFNLDRQNAQIQLSGEADSYDALSRQVATFEKDEYVKSLGGLTSSLNESSRVDFNLTLTLDPSIFSQEAASILNPATPTDQFSSLQAATGSQGLQVGANQKLITSFHLLLNPVVMGAVDQTNYAVSLDVPYGTDLTSISPAIVASPGAGVLPPANTPQNFTNPVTYTVIAADGSTQTYKVTVNILPNEATTPQGKSNAAILIAIMAVVIIAVIIGVLFFAWKKMQTKKLAI